MLCMSSTGLGMPITYYIHHTYNYDGCISRSVHVLLTIYTALHNGIAVLKKPLPKGLAYKYGYIDLELAIHFAHGIY